VHVDHLASGNQLLSWAPVFYSSPLWYNVIIRSLADHNQDGFPDEVFTVWNRNRPYVEIPANTLPTEPLAIFIVARDASTGALENNRSYSLTFGYEGVNFDYSTLNDDDMDNWASNLDNCPDVASSNLADFDEDGIGDVCDDSDDDGVLDVNDHDPLDPDVGQSLDLQVGTAEIFESGETVLIQWPTVENAASYVLKYTLDNGSTWGAMGTSPIAELQWTVPLVETTKKDCLIKVTAKDDGGDKLGAEKTAVTFTVKPPQPMTLLTDLNASYDSGDSLIVDWFAPMAAATMKVQVTTDGGSSWATLDTVSATDNPLTLALPFVAKDSSSCQLKLTAKAGDGTTLSTAKSVPFTLIAPFSLTSPDGGEEWVSGEQESITWSLGNLSPETVDKVKMVYSTNGGKTWLPLVTLEGPEAAVTNYLWTLPTVGKDKPKTIIKITLKDAGGITLGKGVSEPLTLLMPLPPS
jgi:hypothetical protein